MQISDAINRSKCADEIDYAAIGCLYSDEPMVVLQDTSKLSVWPVWTLQNDYEGRAYVDYIAKHPSYDKVFVRSAVADRLRQAAKLLPDGYVLIVRSGHRPSAVQKRLLNDVVEEYMQAHPAASEVAALEHARTFVSDPDIKLPPHCCGAAVDVELFDSRQQKLVDCGSPFNLNDEISFTHCDSITLHQKANRMMLLEAMLAAGFASYYPEWWHFSYGDQVWAWFYGEDACLYGIVEI